MWLDCFLLMKSWKNWRIRKHGRLAHEHEPNEYQATYIDHDPKWIQPYIEHVLITEVQEALSKTRIWTSFEHISPARPTAKTFVMIHDMREVLRYSLSNPRCVQLRSARLRQHLNRSAVSTMKDEWQLRLLWMARTEGACTREVPIQQGSWQETLLWYQYYWMPRSIVEEKFCSLDESARNQVRSVPSFPSIARVHENRCCLWCNRIRRLGGHKFLRTSMR